MFVQLECRRHSQCSSRPGTFRKTHHSNNSNLRGRMGRSRRGGLTTVRFSLRAGGASLSCFLVLYVRVDSRVGICKDCPLPTMLKSHQTTTTRSPVSLSNVAPHVLWNSHMTHVRYIEGMRRKQHAYDHADASIFGGSGLPCGGLPYCTGTVCIVGTP